MDLIPTSGTPKATRGGPIPNRVTPQDGLEGPSPHGGAPQAAHERPGPNGAAPLEAPERPNPNGAAPHGDREVLRRVFDIAGATLLVLLVSPLLVAAMALVLIAGGRPVFFGHRRLGRSGRIFRCWKLRTMAVDAEDALDRDPTLRDAHRRNGFKLPTRTDPRVTDWGRLLRRSYVDEIPQLFNVIDGDMSLVGPRPIVPAELDLFGPAADLLLRVKPGVFGAWNSRGRDRPPYPERVAVELEYVRNRGLRRDVAILVRSIRAVLQGEGEP